MNDVAWNKDVIYHNAFQLHKLTISVTKLTSKFENVVYSLTT